jgi:hypothetical protein
LTPTNVNAAAFDSVSSGGPLVIRTTGGVPGSPAPGGVRNIEAEARNEPPGAIVGASPSLSPQ